jgi:branched-chain amino acid transport system ATP-binding protein
MLLTVDKVSKKFGGLQALREVDLHVEEKDCRIDRSQWGRKRTLFNLITGFLKPDEGSVHFQNKEITGLSAHQICQTGIARTFQIAKPFEDLTVFKTVTIGALVHSPTVKQAEKKTEALLHRLRLEDKKEKLGRSLTVVERKRLELARALASEPSSR